jgi:hypothetical protein
VWKEETEDRDARRPVESSGLFAQARVVHRYADQFAGTESEAFLQQGREERMRIPLSTGMQKVLTGPRLLLASTGPEDARDGGAPNTSKEPSAWRAARTQMRF